MDCAALTFAEVTNSRVPPQVPAVLITGLGPRQPPGFVSQALREDLQRDQDTVRAAKLRFHKAWVDELPRGRLVATENSGHGVPWEEPELIIQAIRDIAARRSKPLNSGGQ